MAFDLRNLVRPIAPGLSGAINPLMFIGSGMASGDMGTALTNMGNLQLAAQRLGMERAKFAATAQEAERKRKQQEAFQAIAPNVARDLYPDSASIQALLASNPQLMAELVKQQQGARLAAAKPPTATSAEKLYAAMGGQTGTGKSFADWYSTDYKGPGTTVNVGGQDMGQVPQGMARVPDPASPTGTRLVMEPGAPPELKKRRETEAKLSNLGLLEDSLARYRAVLEEYGPRIRAGEGTLALDNAYTDLLMKQKEAANLGALTGPDLDLMERMTMDPTSIKAQVYDYLTGPDPMIKQLDQIQKTIDDAKARARGETPDSAGGGDEAGGEKGEPPQTTFTLPDGTTAQILGVEKVAD